MAFLKLILKLSLLFARKTLLTIDYLEGYNFHFKISEDEAESLLPQNLKPLKLKILKSDTESNHAHAKGAG